MVSYKLSEAERDLIVAFIARARRRVRLGTAQRTDPDLIFDAEAILAGQPTMFSDAEPAEQKARLLSEAQKSLENDGLD